MGFNSAFKGLIQQLKL